MGAIIYLEMCNDRGESGQRPQHAPIPGASPSPANSTLLFLSNTAGLASEHTYFLENTYFRPWEYTLVFIILIFRQYFWGFEHAKIFPRRNQTRSRRRKLKSGSLPTCRLCSSGNFRFILRATSQVDLTAFKFTSLPYAIGKDRNRIRPNNGLSWLKDMQEIRIFFFPGANN